MIIASSLTLIVTLTSSLTKRQSDIDILRTYVLELIGTIEADRQIHRNSLTSSRNNNTSDIIINTERDSDVDSVPMSNLTIHFLMIPLRIQFLTQTLMMIRRSVKVSTHKVLLHLQLILKKMKGHASNLKFTLSSIYVKSKIDKDTRSKFPFNVAFANITKFPS